MNILFCSTTLPYPIDRGDKSTIFHLSKYLSINNNIYYLYLNTSGKDDIINRKNLLKLNYISHFYEISISSGNIFWRAFHFLFPDGEKYLYRYNNKIKNEIFNTIETIIELYKIDVLNCFHQVSSLIIANYKFENKFASLMDSQTLYLDRKRKGGSFLKKIYKLLQKRHNMTYERFILTKFKKTIVVSEIDAAFLKKIMSDALVEVIPIGIEYDFFNRKNNETQLDPVLCFTGNMDFQPNIDSVIYTVTKILPLIKQKIGKIVFYIVGKNPTKAILNLHNSEDIIVTGYVEDVRDYLSRSSIFLAPMISGSGMKNKILEAMSMGLVVVSNVMGVEAMSEDSKKNIIIGSSCEEIAVRVTNLLSNEKELKRIGKLNRDSVIKEYSWNSSSNLYENMFIEGINL